MKIPVVVLLLGLSVIVGCGTPRAGWQVYVAQQNVAKNRSSTSVILEQIKAYALSISVPYPEHTPYDAFPALRTEYLAGFEEGWRFAVSGEMLRATRIPLGHSIPWGAGFRAGVDEFSLPVQALFKGKSLP